MPVRSRSDFSRPAKNCFASEDMARILSSSSEKPFLMTPPRSKVAAGSSAIAAAISSITPGQGFNPSITNAGALSPARRSKMEADFSSPTLRATSSRGIALPLLTRLMMRSRSGISASSAIIEPRSMASLKNHSTACCRSVSAGRSSSGWPRYLLSRRPPMDVLVISMAESSDPCAVPHRRLLYNSRLRVVWVSSVMKDCIE